MEFLKAKIMRTLGIACYNPPNKERVAIPTAGVVHVDMSQRLVKRALQNALSVPSSSSQGALPPQPVDEVAVEGILLATGECCPASLGGHHAFLWLPVAECALLGLTTRSHITSAGGAEGGSLRASLLEQDEAHAALGVQPHSLTLSCRVPYTDTDSLPVRVHASPASAAPHRWKKLRIGLLRTSGGDRSCGRFPSPGS
jgi:hypothetical protein